MIIEWLIQVAGNVVVWLADVFPEWEIPEWFLDPQGPMRIALEGYMGLGVWIDWGVLGTCLLASGGAFLAGGGLKIFRSLLSHLPFIGGNGN